MEIFTNKHSFLRPWRVRTRKPKYTPTNDSATSTPSTGQEIVGQSTQVIVASAITTRNEPVRNDAAQGHTVESNLLRPVTPEEKDQYKLYPLHKPAITDTLQAPGQFPIDIVAVHGLDGRSHKTWTHGNGYFWLQDSLPKDFPGARVYTFGYPAAVLFTRANSGITEFATTLLEEIKAVRKTKEQQLRPLIFICHSMGGLVVKKAFNTAVIESKRYGPVLAQAKAILFFATPHGGSEYADFFSKLALVINVPLIGTSRFSGKTNAELIKSLSLESPQLNEIADQFRHRTKDLIIFSLTEELPVPGLKYKVVEQMSGRLHVDTETAIPMLECDHRTICRFSGPEDPNYRKVYNIMEEIAISVTAKYEATLLKEDEPCLHSLSYPSMTSRAQETTLTTNHPQSCTWILTHPSYLHWSSSTSQPHPLPPQPFNPNILWIKGHPGTGKSTLLSFLTHHFTHSAHPILKPPILLSFFFNGTGSTLQKSPLGLFRSLLHQIYTQSFFARKAILAFYTQKCKENGICGVDWEWGLVELRELFEEVVGEFIKEGDGRELVIFVDALDEAFLGGGGKAAGELMEYLKGLCVVGDEGKEGDGGRVRICVSSRHYPVIAKMDGLVINVEDGNRSDIDNFVSYKLQSGVVDWEIEKEEDRREFERAFVQKANGVFLWASKRIEKITEGLNDGVFSLKNIREMIEFETNELSALYEGILLNDVAAGLRSRSLVMLRWVCLAERPLTLGELRYAMAYDSLHDKILEDIEYEELCPIVDDDARMEKLLKSLSGGLAEVRYSGKEGTVQVFHQSVNDFLRDGGLAILHASTGSADVGKIEDVIGMSEDIIAKSCLRYLRCGELLERAAVWMAGIEKTHVFIKYATIYWAVHARKAEEHGIGQEYLVQYFGSDQRLLEAWGFIYRAVAYLDSRCPGAMAGTIHIASIFNIETMAICSLQKGATLDDEDDINGSTPLGLAAKYGHATLVQRYIDLGATFNGSRQTPLELAAAGNQVSTVRVLLKNGALLNSGATSVGFSLGDAAEHGNTTLVRILIEAGADVNQVKGHYGTALAVAAYKGKDNVVKLLVQNGADINIQAGYFGCALQAAICGSYEHGARISRYLISMGADVNLQGGLDGNPLQAAVDIGDIEIMKMLLDRGADVNAQGGKHGTVLQAAAMSHQRIDMIHILVAHGADVNAQAGEYGTALQAAAANGEEEVAELLLSLGADVNAKGGRYGNALQAAVKYPEGGGMVDLLIEHGARIEENCGYYGNVLQAAISAGNEMLAKRFLSMGMNINETGGYHGDNLQAAFPSCKESFIKYLLEQGANVNVVGGEFGSPLRAAIFWNRPSMVKLFLEYGADSNERVAGFSGTPLYQAAIKGDKLSESGKEANLEIVQLLLDNGADMESHGPWEKTPIHLAIDRCHKDVVQLLLARGAHLDIPQEKRRALKRLLESE